MNILFLAFTGTLCHPTAVEMLENSEPTTQGIGMTSGLAWPSLSI